MIFASFVGQLRKEIRARGKPEIPLAFVLKFGEQEVSKDLLIGI
jgi:hypothetical protein